MTTEEREIFTDADVVYSYSRKQAIDDGVLVDATPIAVSHGLQGVSLVFTAALNSDLTPPKDSRQDYAGRAHDVLGMYQLAVTMLRKFGKPTDLVQFQVKIGREIHTIQAVIDGGDNGEPSLTIGYPDDF